MNESTLKRGGKISLLVSDVDGTLVTKEKILTNRTVSAVQKLNQSGIRFAITSSRPPKGMSMFVEPLKLTTPLGAYNGGTVVQTDMTLVSQKTLPRNVADGVISILRKYSLAVWLYIGNDWYIQDLHGAHVDRETFVTHIAPRIVSDFEQVPGEPNKLVGVNDDAQQVERCEDEVKEQFGLQVSATRSQPHYLDVTHPQANKGAFIETLAHFYSIDAGSIATIGDGSNDVSMFRASGISIAMGNASEAVKKQASHVTATNEEDGFAEAVEKIVLGAMVSS